MTSMKDEGPSRHKGKKVADDDPLAKTMSEEAPISKSNCFEKEEEGRNPNSKCPPLIDSRYDAHIHFPVVPDNYLPPPASRVWLSIYHRNTEVSWSPFASSIFNLDTRQRTSLPLPILFEFGLSTSLG